MHRGIPPTVHKVHARRLGQVQSNTSCFQTDKKYGNIDIIHWGRQVKPKNI